MDQEVTAQNKVQVGINLLADTLSSLDLNGVHSGDRNTPFFSVFKNFTAEVKQERHNLLSCEEEITSKMAEIKQNSL